MSENMILFLDIDNTLLTTDRTLTEENAAAIRDALDRGRRIVICSGRPLGGIEPIASRLGLTREGCFLIAFNGGMIYDCGKKTAIKKETLPLDGVRILYEKAAEHKLYIHTYSRHHFLVRSAGEEAEFYTNSIGMPYIVDPKLPDSLKEEPVKALVIDLHDKTRLERYRAEVAPLVAGRVSLFFSSEVLLECVREGVSKGAALHWLCDYLGIPRSASVAAGDSENDIPMLEAAGTGCAMANASSACKAAADYVTERDCDHSGVAEIIRKFL